MLQVLQDIHIVAILTGVFDLFQLFRFGFFLFLDGFLGILFTRLLRFLLFDFGLLFLFQQVFLVQLRLFDVLRFNRLYLFIEVDLDRLLGKLKTRSQTQRVVAGIHLVFETSNLTVELAVAQFNGSRLF